MMRILVALLPVLVFCGCTTVYEKPEIRWLEPAVLTPKESRYSAAVLSSASPKPLPKKKVPVVWSEELYSRLQSVDPQLFLQYSSDIRKIRNDHEAGTRFLQTQFADVCRRFPVELTGNAIQAGLMLKDAVPAESAMTLSGEEEDFIRAHNLERITIYNRLKTLQIQREVPLNELKSVFGNPTDDRDLCQYPAYAVQKLAYLGLCNRLAYTVRQIREQYKQENR